MARREQGRMPAFERIGVDGGLDHIVANRLGAVDIFDLRLEPCIG